MPVIAFPVRAAAATARGRAQLLVRISAQAYNRPGEYDALAATLAKRVRAASGPRSLLGRLRRG